MRLGLLGIQPGNPNLGVAALAYSIVGIVNRLVPGPKEVVLFSENSAADLTRMAETLKLGDTKLVAKPIRHRNIRALVGCVRALRECDVVIDLTGGDSFSDIYGIRRLLVKLVDKQLALMSGRPLVIAPQTVGPFRHRITLPWVRHIVKNAAVVLTRDLPSRDLLTAMTRREVLVSTDVAVTLPWENAVPPLIPRSRPRVAFNTSGLLWNGGYTGNNQFGLRADYRAYCDLVVRRLCAAGYAVHLISHVFSGSREIPEDDLRSNRDILAEHPDCILAPEFRSPVDAKSYIARMDVFIGARLHASIAALTSGVPTVPVAYSRKFAGFFGNLGYSNIIDLESLDAVTAAELTLALVRDREKLRPEVDASNEVAQRKIEVFLDSLSRILR